MPRENIRLPESWIEKLVKQPESGMGHQVVRVSTFGGEVYENVMVTNCDTIIGIYGCDAVPFSVEEIKDIEVTHLQKPSGFDQKNWSFNKK